MTRDAILALSPNDLPRALQAQGLLPTDVSERPLVPGTLWLPSDDGFCIWQPHEQIAHAWPLVAMWGLTIAPSRSLGQGSWWAGQRWGDGCFAATFADLPAAICRAVLLCDATRAPFEGGPHAD